MSEVQISAIIPVHNGAATVVRAVESALAQREPHLETIVVDDGSTDGTGEILGAYRDRVRIIRIARSGPAAARNAGVAAARGEYVGFLDADDEWRPGFIASTASALACAPEAALAFSEIDPIDEWGQPVAHFLPAGDLRRAPTMNDLLTRWWPIVPSAVVMSRRVFERCGGFPREFTSPGYEDTWLWLRAREHGDFEYVAEPLVRYRMSPELHRMQKYMRGFEIFARMVKERYGAGGARLVENLRHAQVSSLGYHGLLHLHLGEAALARGNFICALRYDPWSVRNVMRLLRTFLPRRFASMLSGRTRGFDFAGAVEELARADASCCPPSAAATPAPAGVRTVRGGEIDTTLVVETYNFREGTSIASLRAALRAAVDISERCGHAAEVVLADVTRDVGVARLLDGEFPTVRRIDAYAMGYDEAKALAARDASGRYVVYLDCDCLPEPGWFENLTAPLRDGRAAVTGGLAHYPSGFFSTVCSLMDFGFLLPHRERRLGCYASNNSAFLREVLLEIPEPDGPMRCRCYAHAQELERRGFPVMLAGGAAVRHEPPPFFRERLRQGYDMVAACWVDPRLPESALLRRKVAAAWSFYRRRLRLDFSTLANREARTGLRRWQRPLAYPIMAAARLIDLAGMTAALMLGVRARRWVDPPPGASTR
jgi:glycosyltransferase involved in cell wall biosynthesis